MYQKKKIKNYKQMKKKIQVKIYWIKKKFKN